MSFLPQKGPKRFAYTTQLTYLVRIILPVIMNLLNTTSLEMISVMTLKKPEMTQMSPEVTEMKALKLSPNYSLPKVLTVLPSFMMMAMPISRDQSLIRPMTYLPLNLLRVQMPQMSLMRTLMMAPTMTTIWNFQFVSKNRTTTINQQ